MVFVWGTNYKLSLYNIAHQSFPATVCTRGSDAAENAVSHAAGRSTVVQVSIIIAVLSSSLKRSENYPVDRLRDEAIIDRSPLSRAPILYLRPPPDKGRALD